MAQNASHKSGAAAREGDSLLRISDLCISFPASVDGVSQPRHRAVDGVSLTVYPQQTVAIVGESGCGKSLTALGIMRLLPPAAHIDRGFIQFQNRNLLELNQRDMLTVRGRHIAMIFQEPMTSLNPVFTVGDQIIEAIQLHQHATRRQAIDIAIQAMHEVGINDPRGRLRAYPHQFSGGMRQRVMIAMALACQPQLLLADEPTTALDVTIQDQILHLLRRLQHDRGMGIVLITHDLGVVAQNADVVCVMYAGRIVEYAPVYQLFERPLHPYTRGLLNSRPSISRNVDRLATIAEYVSDPAQFRLLSNGRDQRMPWWPNPAAHDSPATEQPLANEYMLCEIRPDHFLGCRRDESDSEMLQSIPEVRFRRELQEPYSAGPRRLSDGAGHQHANVGETAA